MNVISFRFSLCRDSSKQHKAFSIVILVVNLQSSLMLKTTLNDFQLPG